MHRSACCAALLALLSLPARGAAQATLLDGLGGGAGYGEGCVPASDDGSSGAIDVTEAFPRGLRFFGATYAALYVNVNGNVSFGTPLRAYTPRAFPVAARPVIAPFFADVDLRGGACVEQTTCGAETQNALYYDVAPGQVVVTWLEVGHNDCRDARRASFQLVLRATGDSCITDGDFDVELRYARCDWTTGDSSGGSGGFGGTGAQAGFDAGNLRDFVEIAGSRTSCDARCRATRCVEGPPGTFAPAPEQGPGRPAAVACDPAISIDRVLCTQSNVTPAVPGVWRFPVRRGAVLCPGAGEPCDTGVPGVCASGRKVCAGAGLACAPEVASSSEVCNALDDDCDGAIDDGASLCGPSRVCEQGRCVDRCFEGGCSTGEACGVRGVCVEPACAERECVPGERCRGGICGSACEGVVCPRGLACRAGRCLDLCAGLACDDATVCESGRCVPRCPECAACSGGRVCAAGRCVDAACATMTCAVGSVCEAGACIDACLGARCPEGQLCALGACVDVPRPDAGVPSRDAGADAGAALDAGTRRDATLDGASLDACVGAECLPPSVGCQCGVARRSMDAGVWLGALLVVLFVRTRTPRRVVHANDAAPSRAFRVR